MKKLKSLFILLPFSFIFFACNNASDSVEKADSTNNAKMESPNNTITTDEASSSFLVDAADGGMTEVKAGQLAQDKAVNQRVKDFGAMMVRDHSDAGDKVKSLANARNVTLPSGISAAHQDAINDLSQKSGKDFDKTFMKQMVDDHQNVIDMFENASGKVNDPEVKTFISNTLPTLRMHLDSAKAIQKSLK